jgi:hypothetical protein
MRLEPLQNDVRRNLENHIGDEEDGQTSTVLSTAEAEILLKTEDGGVGHVGSVEEGQEIHDRQDRNEPQVDLGDESALRDPRWQHRCLAISVASSGVCQVWIVSILTITGAMGVVVGMLGLFIYQIVR